MSSRNAGVGIRGAWCVVCVSFALLLILVGASAGNALQTFRVGGEPTSPLWRAWTDTDPGVLEGEVELVSEAALDLMEPVDGALRPIWLDPSVNLMSRLYARWEQAGGGGRLVPIHYEFSLWAAGFIPSIEELARAADGDPTTWMRGVGMPYPYPGADLIVWEPVDLHGLYRINRFRVLVGEQELSLPDTLEGYEVGLGVALQDTSMPGRGRGTFPISHVVAKDSVMIRSPGRQYYELDVTFPSEVARYVTLEMDDRIRRIAEYEVYGEDLVPEASYTSSILYVGSQGANWGDLRVSADAIGPESGCVVHVRTRSGTDSTPVVYQRYLSRGDTTRGIPSRVTAYSAVTGEPLTREEYEALSREEKVEEENLPYDVEHWSPWSRPIAFEEAMGEASGEGGVRIPSPGPRSYIQFRIDIWPKPKGAFRFNFIELDFGSPVARRVVGEIAPAEAALEKTQRFTYAVAPRAIRGDDTGFNAVRIAVPDREVQVDSVLVDGVPVDDFEEDLFEERGHWWLQVRLLAHRIDQDDEVLEVIFRSRVFQVWTSFDAEVFDSQREEVPQPVVPGDVILDSESNGVIVRTALGRSLIDGVSVTPVITPNEDGMNDVAQLSYILFRVTREVSIEGGDVRPTSVPISVRIYDLTGHLVRTVYKGDDEVGVYGQVWDGRDDAGHLVEVGTYIYRIAVDADAGLESKMGTIAVVY